MNDVEKAYVEELEQTVENLSQELERVQTRSVQMQGAIQESIDRLGAALWTPTISRRAHGAE
jgi:predicted metalloprotease with PDZ domain